MTEENVTHEELYNKLNAEQQEFIRGLAKLLAASNAEMQRVFFGVFALEASGNVLEALEAEVEAFSGEEESIALAALSRAINERDYIESRDLV